MPLLRTITAIGGSTTSGISATGTITAVTAVDAATLSPTDPNYVPHFQDDNGTLYAVIVVALTITGPVYPFSFGLWFDREDGKGFIWNDAWTINVSGGVVQIKVFAETDSSVTEWKVAVKGGVLFNPPSLPTGTTQATFTPPLAAPPGASDVVDAHFVADGDGNILEYIKTSGGIKYWIWHKLAWTQPTRTVSPDYWFSFPTIQKGHYVGPTWVPALDKEGTNEAPINPATGQPYYLGRKFSDSGTITGLSGALAAGMLVSYFADFPPTWTLPPVGALDDTFRVLMYSVSLAGSADGGEGTIVLQTGAWPGGADHFDLVPDEQALIDMSLADPATLSGLMTIDPSGKLGPTVGYGENIFLNSGFEQGIDPWAQEHAGRFSVQGAVTRSTASLYAATINTPVDGDNLFQITPVKPGDTISMQCWYRSASGANGHLYMGVLLYDAAGAFISGALHEITAAATTTWTLATCFYNTGAPGNAAYAALYIGGAGSTTGDWYFDDASAVRSTINNQGTVPNPSGGHDTNNGPGVKFNLDGTFGPDLGYTMRLDGTNKIVLSNLDSFFGLPSLPSAHYPANSVIINLADGKLYRNPSGVLWVRSSDPTDLVAGAVASGVTIAAAQIAAGTLIAGVTYTGLLVASQVSSGTFTGVSLSLTKNGINTLIDNIFDSSALTYVGVKIKDNSSTQYSYSYPAGFGIVSSGGASLAGLINQSNTYGYLYLNGGGGSQIVAQPGVGIRINGQTVLTGRYPTTPTTLANVIAVLQWHGLCP